MAEELFRPTSWPEPATRQQFGFHLDEDAWLARLRAADARATLDRLGPYELIEQVGRGAQGVVYKARQPTTGREVVIKRLSAGVFATPAMRARFEREIEAAAALEHPNIVTVYGAEFVEGQPLLVMKWIDGVAIDRWACAGPNGRRPIAEILTLFQRVCDAVHHAHQRGVIHRDLKPSNILVDRRNEPHVLDFGLAKPLRGLHADFSVTETGQFLGTPAYASPEQWCGSTTDVNARSDVYSLGAVLHVLLTGESPVDPRTPTAAIPRNLDQAAERSLALLRRVVDRRLAAVVMKALSVSPARRYAGADDLGRDLERYRLGEPVHARPRGALTRVQALLRRHRARIGVTTVVTALAASGLVNAAYQRKANEADRRSQLAEQGRQHADASAALDAQLERALQLNTEGRLPEAEALFREVYDKRRALLGDAHWSIAAAAQPLGDQLLRQLRVDDAAPVLERAYAVTSAHHGSVHPVTLSSMRSLADLRVLQGNYAAAAELCHALIAGDARLAPEGASDASTYYAMLARARLLEQRWTESAAAADEAARRLTARHGPRHRYPAHWMIWSAIARRHAGDEPGAHAAVAAALAVLEPMAARKLRQSPRPSDMLFVLRDTGVALVLAGRSAEAEPLLRDATEMCRKTSAATDATRYGSVKASLGACLVRLGRLSEAEPLLIEGIHAMRTADYLNWKAFAAHGLIELYDLRGAPQEAARWRDQIVYRPPGAWRADASAASGPASPAGSAPDSANDG
ncbi:MAG: protein kinase [Phycisphaerae bacterium]